MSFGYSLHIVCGRIGTIREGEHKETKVLTLSVASKIFPKKASKEEVNWFEFSLWGRDAEIFKQLNFKKGDKIALLTSSLFSEIWQDRQGNYHSSLKGKADKFFDLRSWENNKPSPDETTRDTNQDEGEDTKDNSPKNSSEDIDFDYLDKFTFNPSESEGFSKEEKSMALEEIEKLFVQNKLFHPGKP
ncbi:MAG: single-stranded DNA-binding protein [Deltaproteobacteria bacterium]|jgi:single-stranded DNA-binding protein|nr:single-stranded DNA-binding protein [Deltaproteobacteria bacterium]